MATIHETTATNGDIQVFTEAYAKSHWTFSGVPGNGVVDTKNLPSSIKITGSDNGQSQDSIYVTRITKDGAIAFDWSFTSDDNQESFEINGKPTSFDSFGYLLDGKFYELAYKNSSGNALINVKAGVEFGFQVRTLDANFAKPGKAIITYFISPNAIMVDSSGFKPESTTTGEVVFGKIDSVIAIRKTAGVPVKVKYNGQDVTEKTIAGWKPLAASQDDSAGRYGLYFYNQSTNQHAKWDIDDQGAFVKGEILTQNQLLLEEEHTNYDFNVDKTIGRKYVAHKSLKGDISFGTTQIGLAIETKSKKLLQVKAGGNDISLDKLGWMVVAAKERSNGEVDLYLQKDDGSSEYAKWRIDSLGSMIKGEYYTYAQLLNDEKSDALDYDGDDNYGASYTDMSSKGDVRLGITQIGIAIETKDKRIVQVTAGGKEISFEKLGWTLLAAKERKNGEVDVYLQKDDGSSQYAKWRIDNLGSMIKGEYYTYAQLLNDEKSDALDYDGDDNYGASYTEMSSKGDIRLGITQIGIAIETKDKRIVQVTAGGKEISFEKLGWTLLAAKERKNGEVDVYLQKDDGTSQYAKWRIDSLGSLIKGEYYTYAQLLNDEKSDALDYDGDDNYGASYTEMSSKGDVRLGTTQIGIAIETKDKRIVQVTAGGKEISFDKLGWTLKAAKERKDGEVDIYLQKDDAPLQFAKWRIDKQGSMIKGELYSYAQLMNDEKSDFLDYDDDGMMGDDANGDAMKMVESSVSIVIASDVMHLVLTGTASINGTGNSSDNIIDGNVGNNILDGKEGRDVLTGGDGADTFVFSTISQTSFGLAGADHITDFRPTSGDKIQIQRNAFGISNTAESTLNAVSGDPAVDTALKTTALFVYDSSNGFLYWNKNGTDGGYGDGGVFAILDNRSTGLNASHVLLA
jgi:Ca2+-binding RTX toxin-like protein